MQSSAVWAKFLCITFRSSRIIIYLYMYFYLNLAYSMEGGTSTYVFVPLQSEEEDKLRTKNLRLNFF